MVGFQVLEGGFGGFGESTDLYVHGLAVMTFR